MSISAAARTRFGYWGHNTRRASSFNRAVILPLFPGRASASDSAVSGVVGVDRVLVGGVGADSVLVGATGGDA